jgi:RNA polymerase sigma-70 factor (ECF subfamily)
MVQQRDLVERAQGGDRAAFATLAGDATDRLFAVALRILRDIELAADATQTALVRIWRDLRLLRSPDRFDAWSHRVVVRVCLSELRRTRRAPRPAELLPGDAVVGDSQLSVALQDELERAFRRLPGDQRAVLVLMYYRDLSVPEIADVLGVPTGTVKSRLHYARSAMRSAIEADARAVPQEGRPA